MLQYSRGFNQLHSHRTPIPRISFESLWGKTARECTLHWPAGAGGGADQSNLL